MEGLNIITPEELQQKLEAGENLEIVDVREDDEVAQGMIPGAKHIKMGEVAMNLDFFEDDKEYILVCRSGRRSDNVGWFLHDHGVKVRNMVGGMLEWKGEVVL